MWINIPQCLVDTSADLIDRITYLEQRILQVCHEQTNQATKVKDTQQNLKNVSNDTKQDLARV